MRQVRAPAARDALEGGEPPPPRDVLEGGGGGAGVAGTPLLLGSPYGPRQRRAEKS